MDIAFTTEHKYKKLYFSYKYWLHSFHYQSEIIITQCLAQLLHFSFIFSCDLQLDRD